MSVHNVKREPMHEDDVYVGRAGQQHDGYFGNPFGTKGGIPCATVAEAIDRFREYAKDRMYRDPEYRARVAALHEQRLFCFCAPGPCHGDVLLELARREHRRAGRVSICPFCTGPCDAGVCRNDCRANPEDWAAYGPFWDDWDGDRQQAATFMEY